MEIRIALTNLGKYNEGELAFEWLDLPCTEEELEEVKERIGINERYEEWFITDYEAPFKIGEYDSLEGLNELAERITELEDYLEDDLEALLEVVEIEEALDSLENGTYWIASGCTDEDDLGRYVVDNGLFGISIPDDLEPYIDFEAIGRDWAMEATLTDKGYLFMR